MEGRLPLKEFLSAYIDKRKLYHARAAKLETINI